VPSSPLDRAALALTVVMPAYNESELLETSVKEVTEALRGRAESTPDAGFEVIIVENGSRDGTAEIADRLATSFDEVVTLHLPTPDYGAALRAGLIASLGDIVINFDVDYYDVAFVDDALARLAEPDQPAIVVGSKRAEGARDERSLWRRFVTGVFSGILRFGFGLQVSDTHGMKAMRRRAVDPLARACHNGTDLFDTELILRAERAGLLTVELPVVVVERRPSRLPIWRRVPRTLWGLVRLRVLLWRQ
jgi:glycosyltransferase involved in cell wall biosynthesis